MTGTGDEAAAARRAAAACRDRAVDHERIAGEVGSTVARVRWYGCERDQVAEAAWAVCEDLRREASSLRATADLLEAAARAAAVCRPPAPVPTWGHAPATVLATSVAPTAARPPDVR